MTGDLMPQLWDVAAQLAPAADPEEHRALTQAEHARVGLADRLRGCVDREVVARLVGGTAVSGRVRQVYRDGLMITDDTGLWHVPLTAVESFTAPWATAVPPAGRFRGSLLGALRDRTGSRVTCAPLAGPATGGVLVAVGADHLVMAVPPRGSRVTALPGRPAAGSVVQLLPAAALAWVRVP